MAKYILLTCVECDQTNEILCDGDNPMFCPDCQSVDSFKDSEEESA